MSSSQLLTSDDGYSQSQSTSGPSAIIEPPPACLTRTRKGSHVLWSPEFQTEFEDWWNTKTVWGQDTRNKVTKHRPLSWGNAKRKQDLWAPFHEAADVRSGKPALVCKLCDKILEHPTPSDTGSNGMTKHISSKGCSASRTGQMTLPQLIQKSHLPLPKKPIPGRFSQEAFERQLVQTILDLNMSFRSVEHPSFQQLLELLRPGIEAPHRTKFSLLVKMRAKELKETVLTGLGSRTKVSIALDCWTSPNNLAFLGVTGYFIDDNWDYREVLLGFQPLRGKHTGKNLAKVVVDVLDSYGILDRLLAVTADNASNNGTLRTELATLLRKRRIDWNANMNTVNCMAHVFQLSVNALLNSLKVSANNNNPTKKWDIKTLSQLKEVPQKDRHFGFTFRKVRALAIAVNSSSQRLERYKGTQVNIPPHLQKGLIEDVVTRWNSSFFMLERAYEMRDYSREWIEEEKPLWKVLLLNDTEWEQVQYLITLLRPFQIYTDALGSTDLPSVYCAWATYNDLFEHLESQRKEIRRSKLKWSSSLGESIQAAKDKLSYYYGRTEGERGILFAVGACLDPSSKLDVFRGKDWAPEDHSHYQQEFLEYYTKNYQEQEGVKYQSRQPSTVSTFKPSLKSALLASRSQTKQKLSESTTNHGSEASQYLIESKLDNNNILLLWKQLESGKPALGQMAKDILAIPVAGVGVERLFSMARDVVTYRRSRFNPDTIANIMMIKKCDTTHVRDIVAREDCLRDCTQENQAPPDDELAPNEPEDETLWVEVDDLGDLNLLSTQRNRDSTSPHISIIKQGKKRAINISSDDGGSDELEVAEDLDVDELADVENSEVLPNLDPSASRADLSPRVNTGGDEFALPTLHNTHEMPLGLSSTFDSTSNNAKSRLNYILGDKRQAQRKRARADTSE